MRDGYARYKGRKKDFLHLLVKYRKQLEQNYKMVDRPDTEKRAVKARLFQELKDEYQVLKGSWGGYAGYDRFFEQPLSNAHLASIATYEDFVPAFRAMLQRDGNFARFYKSVRRLAETGTSERHRVLAELAPPIAPATLMVVQRSDTAANPASGAASGATGSAMR
jgi:predicted aminopeptidase